jgi:eukaryotic-like serine/threonine-protein kinase
VLEPGHWTLDGIAAGIAEIDSVLRAHPVAASVALSADPRATLAQGYAMLGQPAKARTLLDQFEARLDTVSRRPWAVKLARIRSLIAMDEGKTDSAVAWAHRGDLEGDGLPTSNCAACTQYLLGLAYDRGRQPDSARKYLTQYAQMAAGGRVDIDAMFLGPALLRLGQLYRDTGDSKHATEYYSRFIDLWKNADPDLQPRVTQARRELADLMKAKG